MSPLVKGNLHEVGSPIWKKLRRNHELMDGAKACERQAEVLRGNAYLTALQWGGVTLGDF